MIKVIEKPKEVKCDCGCKFTFEAEDVELKFNNIKKDKYEHIVRCPFCKRQIDV
jgi:molybdate-binding protein